jgi:5-aminopentanamidase
MNISLVQISLSECLEENLNKHLSYIEKLNSDLIVFPECSLTGYTNSIVDKYRDLREYRKLQNALKELFDLSAKLNKHILVGTLELENNDLYNSSCLIKPDNTREFYRKINLTENEKNFFKAGTDKFTFSISKFNFGVLICRDQSDFSLFEKLKKQGAEYIIIQAAHYYKPEITLWKKTKNIAIPITRALDLSLTVLKVNAVGTLNGNLSHGNSLVADKNGKVINMLDEVSENVLNFIIE